MEESHPYIIYDIGRFNTIPEDTTYLELKFTPTDGKFPEFLNSLVHLRKLDYLWLSSQNYIELPELPDSLTELNCTSNKLRTLPRLPASLKILVCDNNELTELPDLPENLEKLECHNNHLTHLPELTHLNKIRGFSFNYNQLTELPDFPENLVGLFCENNRLRKLPELKRYNNTIVFKFNYNELTELPDLPENLERLECNHNQLTELPDLPENLVRLECEYNQLRKLPILPNTLKHMLIGNNQFGIEYVDILYSNRFGEVNIIKLNKAIDIIHRIDNLKALMMSGMDRMGTGFNLNKNGNPILNNKGNPVSIRRGFTLGSLPENTLGPIGNMLSGIKQESLPPYVQINILKRELHNLFAYDGLREYTKKNTTRMIENRENFMKYNRQIKVIENKLHEIGLNNAEIQKELHERGLTELNNATVKNELRKQIMSRLGFSKKDLDDSVLKNLDVYRHVKHEFNKRKSPKPLNKMLYNIDIITNRNTRRARKNNLLTKINNILTERERKMHFNELPGVPGGRRKSRRTRRKNKKSNK